MLDSLDAEGNTSTKQDTLSSQVHSEDGCPDDKDSYGLDIQDESCLGFLDGLAYKLVSRACPVVDSLDANST